MSRYFATNLFGVRQLDRVPPAAQRFDQLDAREKLLGLKCDVCLLLGQQVHLRGEDIKVWIKAPQISSGRQLNVTLRRLYREILLLKILGEN
jgi:hypothetical protein